MLSLVPHFPGTLPADIFQALVGLPPVALAAAAVLLLAAAVLVARRPASPEMVSRLRAETEEARR
ncbi:hypothetical protein CDO52_13150 [Nocardiopsis gilva YIM 90087]|uniref:Uncharacterized protein n=1 Tax=Nocardiopsis gilva YIM 90087 TaxID=1235441 RepID=A0A223S659_9ACTN|nr:hypothetical protein CDO52_13150 [Nocardiopsis gilva YIM 90087]